MRPSWFGGAPFGDAVPDCPSKRARKRLVNDGVRRLLDTPGWNPHDFVAGREAERGPVAPAPSAERALAGAEACEACAEARRTSADPSALCERHLAEALGFSS